MCVKPAVFKQANSKVIGKSSEVLILQKMRGGKKLHLGARTHTNKHTHMFTHTRTHTHVPYPSSIYSHNTAGCLAAGVNIFRENIPCLQ